MPAQIRSTAGSNSGASATASINATMPTGFVAGDLLIGIATGASSAVPSARPSGSTSIRNIADTSLNMDVVRKTAVGGDTFSWSASVARKWSVTITAIIAGTWDSTTVFDVENGINFTSGTAAFTYTTPAVTVAVNDCLLLAAFGSFTASTWTQPAQTPAMIEAVDTTSTGTSAASSCLTHSMLNAIPLGSISRQATASLSSINACMWIGAIRPGPGSVSSRWGGVPSGTKRQRAQIRASAW